MAEIPTTGAARATEAVVVINIIIIMESTDTHSAVDPPRKSTLTRIYFTCKSMTLRYLDVKHKVDLVQTDDRTPKGSIFCPKMVNEKNANQFHLKFGSPPRQEVHC
uniref:Uncharacterized protein n=1 Tax=Schistocephalus solidus TaxID=70667 RepID=A0A0V0J5S7_SCHSO